MLSGSALAVAETFLAKKIDVGPKKPRTSLSKKVGSTNGSSSNGDGS